MADKDSMKRQASKNKTEFAKLTNADKKTTKAKLPPVVIKEGAGKAAAAKKSAVKGAGAGAASKIVQDITNRYRVTAREARDIVTAVSTSGKALGKAMEKGNVNRAAQTARKSTVDIAKQVGEVGKAAVTGKKGTTAMTYKDGFATKSKRK